MTVLGYDACLRFCFMSAILTDLISAILLLAGAGTAEELGESEMERFYHFARHPLRINQAPKSRLLSCGLFSSYQAEAIEEYRAMNGDILSLSEFALVDGIGPVAAEALGYFVSFESTRPPGQRESVYIREDLMVRGGYKAERGSSFGLKYHSEMGERVEFYWSTRRNYSSAFVPGTLSLAIYGRRGGKILIGDFGARFGQGLALWSSFSMSGFSAVESFRRNACGFSPTSSFSSILCGLASDYTIGRWTISIGLAVPALRAFLDGNYKSFSSDRSLMPMAAVSKLGDFSLFGFQAFWKDGFVASADGVLGLGHWSLFGEAALSSRQSAEEGYVIRRTRFAALAGVSWSPVYKVKAALVARYYPSGFYAPFAGAPRSGSSPKDEAGLALGFRWNLAEFTSDAALHPDKQKLKCKTILNLKPIFSVGKFSVYPSLRWTESWTKVSSASQWRHELRADISALWRGLQINTRAHVVRSKDWGRLAYLELGYKTSSSASSGGSSSLRPPLLNHHRDSCRFANMAKASPEFSIYLRGTVFNAPDWADRIYCYERDLPGSFSVQAIHGRGGGLSSFIGLKSSGARRFRYSIYFKFSFIGYLPSTGPSKDSYSATTKPSVAELKLQLQTAF